MACRRRRPALDVRWAVCRRRRRRTDSARARRWEARWAPLLPMRTSFKFRDDTFYGLVMCYDLGVPGRLGRGVIGVAFCLQCHCMYARMQRVRGFYSLSVLSLWSWFWSGLVWPRSPRAHVAGVRSPELFPSFASGYATIASSMTERILLVVILVASARNPAYGVLRP